MPLRFTVLGDVRVWRDEVEVDPGPPLRRTLLALLLARSGSPVPLPDIVDSLWAADRQPARAVNMVHRHVGALRRLLEPGLPNRAVGSLLLRGGGGYRLLAPVDSVDLLLFRQRVAGARKLVEKHDTGRAVEEFADALALRYGPTAGCPAEAAPHPVFTELDREYDAVVREAADVALGCGAAGRVMPALTETATRHPFDEGLQSLLVRALTQTGRRAEALEVFRSTATRLTEELGVDPGPELTAAGRGATAEPEAARARGGGEPDATGTARRTGADAAGAEGRTTECGAVPEAPPAPDAPPMRPAQLPPALPVFVGREAELVRLHALLDETEAETVPHSGARTDPDTATLPPTVISAIGGLAGVGKTTLALHLAHDVADRFPGGQLYVNLRGFAPAAGPTHPQDALRGFLEALGVPAARIPEGLDARAALYRSLLAGRRVLVLLDNARDGAQVRPLLPGAPGCLVLVTSRNRLTGLVSADGAHPLPLDVLTPAEARSALALRIGAARVAAEPEAVSEIVSLTARLPLALAMVAARAAAHPGFPLAALAGHLRAAHGGLDAFGDADPATDVRAVFSWSYDALGVPAARLFRLLSLHPDAELTVHAAAALAGEPVAGTRALLDELTDAHLLTERSPGRYGCHDLLRAYATELVHATESGDECRAALRRMLDHYLRTAHAAALLFDPPTSVITPVESAVRGRPLADEAAALAWLTAERPALLGAFRQAVEHGFDAHVWQLAWTLERFHERHGHWPEYLALQRAALESARRLADPVALAQAHRGLGRACMMLRHYTEAYDQLHASLGEFAAFGNADGQAQARLSLWALLVRQGRHEQGLETLAPALGLYRESGNRRGQADVLVATAWSEAGLGEGRRALTHARRALALFQELGIRLAEGYTWDTLGHVHSQLGRPERSVACHRRALDLFREVGDLFNEACVLDRIGDAQQASGHPTDALGTWREAHTALRAFDPVWAAEVARKITTVTGEVTSAVTGAVTSQAHFVHCALPTLPPPSNGPQGQ
ncbi:tetratricopeptide repeat protein [Streptomyces sp. NBC_01478]|uniref:AfsR/SARP family transcriptional regulator n=1 Tax=Streptomyces sp. NBC_01478 TaxID=2903882 RepID=UPI002E359596|nr:BTAD domain-containing putative transcriptional regulator [Streptomyces sp. NBC_01478]